MNWSRRYRDCGVIDEEAVAGSSRPAARSTKSEARPMLSSALKQVGQRVSRLDRTLIMLVVLLTSVFPVELFPNAPPPPKGIDGQYSGRQGQVVLVKVPVTEEATEVKGN